EAQPRRGRAGCPRAGRRGGGREARSGRARGPHGTARQRAEDPPPARVRRGAPGCSDRGAGRRAQRMTLHPLSERFAEVAEVYERGRAAYAPAVVGAIAAELGLAPGARVLDLGAGTGKLTRALLEFG